MNNTTKIKLLEKVADVLKNGQLAVIPTDTVYGIVASALDKNAVERVYKVRGRNVNKPCIVLCGEISDLSKLGIVLSENDKEILSKIWPNPVSVILPCLDKKFDYLHRGINSLAIRIPKLEWLRKLLNEVGPIVAPSANLEGKPPAKNIIEAKRYFGERVSFYFEGKVSKDPSTIVLLSDGKLKVLRDGKFNVPSELLF